MSDFKLYDAYYVKGREQLYNLGLLTLIVHTCELLLATDSPGDPDFSVIADSTVLSIPLIILLTRGWWAHSRGHKR